MFISLLHSSIVATPAKAVAWCRKPGRVGVGQDLGGKGLSDVFTSLVYFVRRWCYYSALDPSLRQGGRGAGGGRLRVCVSTK